MKKITLCVFAFYTFLWVSLEYRTQSREVKQATPLFKKIPKTDRPATYLEFHRGIRTRDDDPAPEYEQNYKWKELRQARQHAAAKKRSGSGRSKSNGVVAWVERGPGNVPGRTRAILNVPGDPANNTWLAGSATGGIWRTINGGLSWTERSKDFPALPISSFASTHNGSVIYASTGEFVSSVFSSIGNGIFKSLDKGLTWQQLPSTNNNPEFSVITRVVTDPSDGMTIVATSVPHNLSTDKTSSIMRSTDGGATWTKVKEITGILEQVIASPDNFNVQYASQHGKGIWKSTDAGRTWQLSNEGMAVYGRAEIAISPVNTNRIFVAAEGNLSGTTADLYYSSDAGATWALVDVQFNGKSIDFFEGQGFYDNAILCDPFQSNRFYVGGVSLFRTTLGNVVSAVDNWQVFENGTSENIVLQSFQNIGWDHERLTVDASSPKLTVELRFGSGKAQKAHRFFVPPDATDGVDASDYAYRDYVNVPFEAWDITNPSTPRQLMVSFRDQNRNGFDLVPQKLDETDPPSQQSREYLYIHNLPYNQTPANEITVAGGHVKNLAYNIFPALAPGANWPASFPDANILIKYTGISKYAATTITAADGRALYDKKNKADQIHLEKGVHPDHHCMASVIVDPAAKTYKLLLGNDGGVFVSKPSADPGTTEGDWQFRGVGFNTSQFYGADKRPGKDQYIGGMQDNGTRFSPPQESANAASAYQFAVGGDGFEALWNNKDDTRILGSVYYGQVYRSIDGGSSWESAMIGLNAGSQDFPFVTKLANSKDFPDRVFTIGAKGVYVSQSFGARWNLTPIPEKFIIGTGFYLDLEVSRADANIVWAGSGMTEGGASERFLHVSKDGGMTFQPAKNYTAVTLGNITKLATHPTEPNTAYALFSFAGSPKILRTKDLGQTWEDLSGFVTGAPGTRGFPDVAVYCLYVRPDNPDILWAGTEIGIVESLDGGETWALIEDFPNVAVWDMKGQDEQVVIATHGRGIWTAVLEADQVSGKTPSVIASGTAPNGDLMLRISTTESYDSVQVRVESRVSKTFYDITPGLHDIALADISAGQKNIRIISYKGRVPFQAANHSMQHHDILSPKDSYSTYFQTLNDLHISGLTLQNFSTAGISQRRSLHTAHNYSPDQTYELLIRTPVRVSSALPILFYRDIGIIEPENDSIIVEATINGLDWNALVPAYDANFEGDKNAAWKNAYLNQRPGNASMFLNHEVDFGDKFSAEDLILFRFRLISGPAITSWGWALDYVSIQEPPLVPVVPEVQKASVSIFPNPTQGNVTLEYILKNPSDISMEVVDLYGKTSGKLLSVHRKAGYHAENLDLTGMAPGTYLILLHSAEGRMAGKVTLMR